MVSSVINPVGAGERGALGATPAPATPMKHPDQIRLIIAPCTRVEAQNYIRHHHRHHKPPVSGIFCLCCVDSSGLVRGVAMVGRPVARELCKDLNLEVNRVATDGCSNACSALLGACRRVAFAMGYARLYTYTLVEEGGASLRGAGWTADGVVSARARGWDAPNRRRLEQVHPLTEKIRWVTTNPKAMGSMPEWPGLDDGVLPGQVDMFNVLPGAK